MSRKASSTRVRRMYRRQISSSLRSWPIGLEQIAAVEPLGLRLLVLVRGPRHGGGRGVVGDGVVPRHARVALLEAPDRLVHLGFGAQAPRADPRLEFRADPRGSAARASPGSRDLSAVRPSLRHRMWTSPSTTWRLISTRDFFCPGLRGEGEAHHLGPAGLVLERVQMRRALRLAAGHEVVMAAIGDRFEIVGEGHPAIDDHGGPPRRPVRASSAVSMSATVVRSTRLPSKTSWAFGKAVAVQDQAHDDLLAVRPVIARVAAFGLRIERALPFEVRRRQVVEIDRVVQVEQRALARGQRLLDRARAADAAGRDCDRAPRR